MTLYRTEHKRNYTVISNSIITDKRLSAKAKWILIYALSRPDNWVFHFNDIVNQGPEGKDSIRNGLKELEKWGFLRKSPQKTDQKGRFSQAEWVFYETPRENSNNFTVTENPPSVNPPSVNPPLLSTEKQSTDLNKIEVSKDTSSRSSKAAPRRKIPEIVFSKEDRKFQNIEEIDRTRWLEAYPGIDLDQEIAKMIIWLESNPRKANKRKWRAFIASWLSKASETHMNREARSQGFKSSSEPETYQRTNTKLFYDWKEKANGALDHCYVKNGYLINGQTKREMRINLKPDAFEALLCEIAGVRRSKDV